MNALCRSLLVGVSGSIAALAIPGYIAFLRRGLVGEVRVIMTEAATKLMPPAAMQAATGNEVFVDEFGGSAGLHVPHIQLTADCDALVVMPATANVIAKAALGLADDLLSASILACPAPVIIVPCMNGRMWFNPATQRNVALARENGYQVMEPIEGLEVADMQPTFGAMPRFDAVLGAIASAVKKQ